MTILDRIIEVKKEEVAALKKTATPGMFRQKPGFDRKCISLKDSLLDKKSSGIIAEFKQKSPSKGIINVKADIKTVTTGYVKAGAAGLSILTDSVFFGGDLNNLILAREANPFTPILRKDFMIDPIQVYEAKAAGADLILLIAVCLEKSQMEDLAGLAKSLGLEVLVEIHNEKELEKIPAKTDLVGVNNRDLQSFKTDVETSVRLGKLIPERFVKISESGLSSPEKIVNLRENGYKGFLIGETFMKTADPADACYKLISKLKKQRIKI
jgi:indole-3-glycerol phosphate synthase